MRRAADNNLNNRDYGKTTLTRYPAPVTGNTYFPTKNTITLLVKMITACYLSPQLEKVTTSCPSTLVYTSDGNFKVDFVDGDVREISAALLHVV